jgi:uncharacterized protein (DUF2236 family)
MFRRAQLTGFTALCTGHTENVTAMDALRTRLGRQLFARVAGPQGPQRRDRIASADGPRWFPEDSAIRRVHGDASMFVGGIRALLLQSLHPLAMAGVAAHSGFRGDPWGRLQRTSHFLAVTTFGSADDAEEMVRRINKIHAGVRGTTADGRPYAASDPHLLKWVHVAEIDSFLRAHQCYGAKPLDARGRDAYVADTAEVATRLGVVDPPRSEAELDAALAAYRNELRSSDDARAAARFLLFTPPLPMVARPAYGLLAAAAVGLMPVWTRWPLRLPFLPVAEATAVRGAGHLATGTIRWALTSP